MPKTYPEQSPYVKGNKIWLELPHDQAIIISAQARDVLKFYKVNEEKFVQKMRELLAECFTNLRTDERGFIFSFDTLSVSKARNPDLNKDLEDSEIPHIKIEIYDCAGRKK